MNVKFITNGIEVDPYRHVLRFGDESISVRPRTFALLLALLQQPQQVLSKQYLLETVWDDVHVDEQVLFQTIRELRQILKDPVLIQTYPRKGYAWTAPVESVPAEQLNTTSELTSTPRLPPFKRRHLYMLLPFLFFLLLSIHFGRLGQEPLSDGPIMVLPMKSNVPGSDHRWVYLGAMDQLIGMLHSDGATLALETEYVLEIVKLVDLPRDFATEEVRRVFVTTGASMVVETTLSGSVEEYRLDYRLHFRNHIKRGVLFGATVTSLVQDLSKTITGHPQQVDLSRTVAFNSELMSRALERKDAGDLAAAATLFTALKELEADNLTARRLLAQVLIGQGKPELAEAELEAALGLAGAVAEEKPRLRFWLAVAQMQHSAERALQTLVVAEAEAAQRRNHLYLAYIAQVRGDLEQALGRFGRAKASFEEAIQHHGIIRCPLGEALTRRQLSKLFQVQGDLDRAERERELVQKLVQTHQLPNIETL